jgi:iduronate 2-sulfatase
MKPALLLFLLAALCPPLHAEGKKLNVLFIMSDDLRPELGCYGAPVLTPNIDKLAAASVRFDRAYCQYPLCNPSRASLLTGQHPTRNGVLDNVTYFRKVNPAVVTLPQHFKNNGYTTVRTGKIFHGGIDDPDSWTEGSEGTPRLKNQRPKAGPPSGPVSVPNPTGAPTTQPKGVVSPQMKASDQRVILAGDGENHADYKTADAAIEAITRLKDQPFFITCGFTKPHAAPNAPQRFYDLYPLDKITLPDDFTAFPTPPPGFPAAALTTQNIDLFWNREANAPEAKLMIQAYRASVSWMDWNVGRVLKALDDNNLRGNTIICFWGDHGYHLGEMGKWSKHTSLFEVGTRVPFFISVPGAKGNGQPCLRTVQSIDFFPTLAARCGLPAPAQIDGQDLSPLLEDPKAAWSHPAFSVAGKSASLHLTIRDERYRYIRWAGNNGGAALIDETKDPHSRTNLATDPAMAETVARLKNQLETRFPAQ